MPQVTRRKAIKLKVNKKNFETKAFNTQQTQIFNLNHISTELMFTTYYNDTVAEFPFPGYIYSNLEIRNAFNSKNSTYAVGQN